MVGILERIMVNILQHGSGDNTNNTAYDGKKSIDYSPFLSSRIRDEENTSVSPTNVLCNKDKTVSTLCNKLYNNTNDKSPHKYPNNTATSSQNYDNIIDAENNMTNLFDTQHTMFCKNLFHTHQNQKIRKLDAIKIHLFCFLIHPNFDV